MNYYRIAICFMLLAFNSHAQDLVRFNETNVNKTRENSFVTITLPFEILEGYHIQSESETLDGSLATEITFEDSNLFEIVSYEYSKKQNEIVVLSQYAHNVLVNKFEVTIRIKLNKDALNLQNHINGQLYYQACTDKRCLFPRTLNFQVLNI